MLVFSVTLTWSHVAVVLKDLIVKTGIPLMEVNVTTVEPPNNGHVGDECFVHCSEVVPSSEVTCIRMPASSSPLEAPPVTVVGRAHAVCPF